jgi:tetratricopeptide (TPR) repeat protein
MSDACNPVTRNQHSGITPSRRYAYEYRNGSGQDYREAVRKLSWPIPSDIPAVGQKSAVVHLPEVKHIHHWSDGEQFLHPTHYTKLRHTDHLSFNKSVGKLGVGRLANPETDVFARLYLGSKTMSRPASRQARGQREMAADVAFSKGDASDAINLYSAAIDTQKPGEVNVFAYQKRCAAYAECGRYREAMQDAQIVLQCSEGAERGPALLRVKTLNDYMKRMNNFEAGYHNSTTTLACLLRPREHRQIVQSNPCTYGRPQSASAFGKGLTRAASLGALLGWDAEYATKRFSNILFALCTAGTRKRSADIVPTHRISCAQR